VEELFPKSLENENLRVFACPKKVQTRSNKPMALLWKWTIVVYTFASK
jgi:hypothetical protein